jgi:hypothetical protein
MAFTYVCQNNNNNNNHNNNNNNEIRKANARRDKKKVHNWLCVIDCRLRCNSIVQYLTNNCKKGAEHWFIRVTVLKETSGRYDQGLKSRAWRGKKK